MIRLLCKWILKWLGWESVGGLIPEPKAIILGVPHTSNWDFIISYLYYTAMGGKAYTMVKKEFFFWPLGYFVRGMGGIPVDRSKAASLVKQIVAEFEKRDSLLLAIAPEGTRKPVGKWKAGFHTIARTANIPVYVAFFDWGRKRVGYYQKIELTDDANADLKRIRQYYKDLGVMGRNPEGMNFGEDLQ
ncbi:MAG: 1-acyl-sn-glycerol-3-phosphate acyltransferase [Marinilabiliales bacterium]|nr:1-acyl-sn-glycerol-3-phosphate acyltransferase [Marinilabiliales bacterium]